MLLTGWQNNGNSTKSNGEMDALTHIVQLLDFHIEELKGYNAQAANAKITKADEDWDYNCLKDSFIETAMEIEVPSGDTNIQPENFLDPLSVIRAAFTDKLSSQFHFSPFPLFQKTETSEVASDTNTNDAQHVQTDLYNSDAFIKEHDHVQWAPTDDKDCKREKVVAALMCWSDATQLANFGTAKLWPIYMLFGNLSKYICASPNSGAVQHLAYIPTIPDSIKHEISKFNVNWKTQSKDILAHCNRELYHVVWRFLLDNDFVHAYKYGIVIKCFDSIECRIYLCFFTYSADYPEKVLLATIRDLGSCPCPCCLCPKSLLDRMGLRRDINLQEKIRKYLFDKVKLAQEWIYEEGYKIRGDAIEYLLKETSSVPTMNAFIERLGSELNVGCMLVVDFMHEFELGVFKALFAHLIQVLYAQDPRLVQELDNW
ncbi:hypothetical protein BT96DRAFT_956576 [Gymnopus androsaceus JB14]|uniref:Uncharacterized protein n=1 Tax=Gymnopus androsaceus JB14 TaxID=1447944 RepID=A0A6A4HUM1_9AGAR|nr:hypothetical protein BT96DRAFT_956576 [Gymnopus androsaceus JB14]